MAPIDEQTRERLRYIKALDDLSYEHSQERARRKDRMETISGYGGLIGFGGAVALVRGECEGYLIALFGLVVCVVGILMFFYGNTNVKEIERAEIDRRVGLLWRVVTLAKFREDVVEKYTVQERPVRVGDSLVSRSDWEVLVELCFEGGQETNRIKLATAIIRIEDVIYDPLTFQILVADMERAARL